MNEPEVRRHDDADVLVGDIASALLDRLEAAQARVPVGLGLGAGRRARDEAGRVVEVGRRRQQVGVGPQGVAGGRAAALGHPRVYLQIDESGFVDCGYCDRRFVLEGGPADTAQ